jgi:flagellar basal-body rod modification protein FlgD
MSAVSGVSSNTATDTAANTQKAASTSGTEALANTSTFLQLLVAQIKNQDPLQPTDGVQFLSQLAQFSQLEQLIDIRQGVDSMSAAQTSTTQSGSSGSTDQSSNSSQTPTTQN